jgi:hypothetical protein
VQQQQDVSSIINIINIISATKPIDNLLHYMFKDESCKDKSMPGNCNISHNCTHVVCKGNVSSIQATVSIEIQRCTEPVAITTVVKVTTDYFPLLVILR